MGKAPEGMIEKKDGQVCVTQHQLISELGG